MNTLDNSNKNTYPYKNICAGLLAHVDAGKTTLSEAFLYTAGVLRGMGRVDQRNVLLDSDELERKRGITIFSKQACFTWNNTNINLLDTPGHADFSAETERVLWCLDYAVLLVSATDGIQGHTATLLSLLEQYDVPMFIFVNKMDQPGADPKKILAELKKKAGTECIDFTDINSKDFMEEIATCGEEALDQYFDCGRVSDNLISHMIMEREIFPCYFGSALKCDGVREFLDGFTRFALSPYSTGDGLKTNSRYPCELPKECASDRERILDNSRGFGNNKAGLSDTAKAFPEKKPSVNSIPGARIYKISHDPNGERLTHLKVTGGVIKVKDTLSNEKINQIRVYSGDKYETVQEVYPGQICAVTGLNQTYPGQGLGFEEDADLPLLEPPLVSALILPEGCSSAEMLKNMKLLEEEDPALNVLWDEESSQIRVQIMGEVQTQILHDIILRRFGTDVSFGPADIIYKETIASPVCGAGHFEPLKHYAEVHLLLEPLKAGSGIELDSSCALDTLDKNWQRLVLTHLAEKEHRGVLTGSPLTDVRITLIAGRAHPKHTEGGDFREATYRAVRQGLMEAENVLLEPYYDFMIEIPSENMGRAMSDLEQMGALSDAPVQEGDTVRISGSAPVSAMSGYSGELAGYTRGFGRISLIPGIYRPCRNQEEIIALKGYDPETDTANSSSSVFCSHGSGYIVPWDQAKALMHVENPLEKNRPADASAGADVPGLLDETWLGVEEIEAIIESVSGANRRGRTRLKRGWKRQRGKETRRYSSDKDSAASVRVYKKPEKKGDYLLVDGYNIIFAWEELSELAKANLDSARGRLLDVLSNYQGTRSGELIAVFDAYRVAGHKTEIYDYNNIHVVFTKEAETADQYIERFAHDNAKNYNVTVATSDGLEQIIIRGEGCRLLSARDLKADIERAGEIVRAAIPQTGKSLGNTIENALKETRQDKEP